MKQKRKFNFSNWLLCVTLSAFGLLYSSCTKEVIEISEMKSYTLVYDLQGGTGGIPEVSAQAGTEVIITSTTPVKDGFAFEGWNTKVDGSGSSHPAGVKYVMPTSDVTLYAQWKVLPGNYVVSFDLQGGLGDFPALGGKEGGKLTIPSVQPTFEKYRFVNWNAKADGTGTAYAPGSEYSIGKEDVVLYAIWVNAAVINCSVESVALGSMGGFQEVSIVTNVPKGWMIEKITDYDESSNSEQPSTGWFTISNAVVGQWYGENSKPYSIKIESKQATQDKLRKSFIYLKAGDAQAKIVVTQNELRFTLKKNNITDFKNGIFYIPGEPWDVETAWRPGLASVMSLQPGVKVEKVTFSPSLGVEGWVDTSSNTFVLLPSDVTTEFDLDREYSGFMTVQTVKDNVVQVDYVPVVRRKPWFVWYGGSEKPKQNGDYVTFTSNSRFGGRSLWLYTSFKDKPSNIHTFDWAVGKSLRGRRIKSLGIGGAKPVMTLGTGVVVAAFGKLRAGEMVSNEYIDEGYGVSLKFNPSSGVASFTFKSSYVEGDYTYFFDNHTAVMNLTKDGQTRGYGVWIGAKN